MQRTARKAVINGIDVSFDFVPGDQVKVKEDKCLDNHEAVGVIQKIDGVIATIRWIGNINRGAEWTVDTLEYVKKICLWCEGTGGDGVDIDDYCPCPHCEGSGEEFDRASSA
jgi:hypothetical protein